MDEEVEHRIKMALAAIVGTVLTLMVSNWMITQRGTAGGIGNLIASSALGLIGGLTLKKYAPIWYAGTFAGMCAASVIPQLWMGFVLGAFVFVIWWALEPLFAGVGGKFGFTAMLSGAVTAIFGALIVPNYNQTDVVGWPWMDLTRYADIEAWIWWFAPLFCALGAVATKWTRENIVIPLTNADNTTTASALIGLVGAMTVPLINAVPGMTSYWSIGWTLGAYIYIGSFIGMAGTPRCRTIWGYAITGIVAGFVWIAIYGFVLFGGKYGTTAFLSVLLFDKAVSKLVEKVKPEWCEVPVE